jgi:hypothetical protein
MKPKRNINPKLEVGDRVILLRGMSEEMDGPSPGTGGEVISVTSFDNAIIYGVNWDDGIKLNLLSDVDTYMLEDEFPKGNLREQVEPHWADDGAEINENFKFGLLRKFLNRLRDSGIVNMFGAGPYLYMGKERIDRLHGMDIEDENEAYDEVLELANKVKDEMIRGVVKIIQKQNKEVTVEEVNKLIPRYSQKILKLHFHLH